MLPRSRQHAGNLAPIITAPQVTATRIPHHPSDAATQWAASRHLDDPCANERSPPTGPGARPESNEPGARHCCFQYPDADDGSSGPGARPEGDEPAPKRPTPDGSTPGMPPPPRCHTWFWTPQASNKVAPVPRAAAVLSSPHAGRHRSPPARAPTERDGHDDHSPRRVTAPCSELRRACFDGVSKCGPEARRRNVVQRRSRILSPF